MTESFHPAANRVFSVRTIALICTGRLCVHLCPAGADMAGLDQPLAFLYCSGILSGFGTVISASTFLFSWA